MKILRQIDTGEVISAGRRYTIGPDSFTIASPETEVEELIMYGAPAVEEVEVDELPEGYKDRHFHYRHGVWALNEDAKRKSALLAAISASGFDYVSAATTHRIITTPSVIKMELVDFFERCLSHGANVADFKDIWKYDGYRSGLSEALENGQINRVTAYIMTTPWALSNPTVAALNLTLQDMTVSAWETACQQHEVENTNLTIGDVGYLLSL